MFRDDLIRGGIAALLTVTAVPVFGSRAPPTRDVDQPLRFSLADGGDAGARADR